MIGASRITYSMATYRQMPEVFRRLHPRFKTPYLSLVLFAGIAPIVILLPGDVNFVGTLYSLGATLSFTVAHAALVRLRMKPDPDVGVPRASEPPPRWCRLAAVRGLRRDRDRRLVPRDRRAEPAHALGRARLDGRSGSSATRSTAAAGCGRSLTETVKAPPAFGAALALEYRRILVPIVPGRPVRRRARRRVPARGRARRPRRRAHRARGAARAAARRRAPEEERVANDELDEAIAIGDTYGVRVVARLVRGRSASAEIVREAERREAEIIVLGSPRKDLVDRRRGVFGSTVDRVMRNAPCRVMVDGGSRESDGRMSWYRNAVFVFGARLRRDRRRAARRHRGERRRRARLRARRAVRRARRRADPARAKARR